ncbi:hypothetical protein RFI_25693 [Reticulomyxa filosa]|uniref:TRAF-type domain-containing protein n=1 Tax=Reticulomyxa filosa TaxID=46433 RepID=X6MDC5_RETFI|nr:hypothetical protein RFI_25693 [Reticulomyxa filosa]|eukprot:ETO11681.1 hypothetical protein RFI_25693 [Reticulomyxa filosa]
MSYFVVILFQLELIDCWFKPFGCNNICIRKSLNDHLIKNMKQHFDLDDVRQFEANICQLKEENADLKIENRILKNEICNMIEINKEIQDDIMSKEEKELDKKETYQFATISLPFAFNLFRSSLKLIKTFCGHTGRVYVLIIQHLMVINSFVLDHKIKCFFNYSDNVICSSTDKIIGFDISKIIDNYKYSMDILSYWWY